MKKILLFISLFFISSIGVNAEEFIFNASDTINNVNSLQNSITRAYEIIKDSSYKYYTIDLIGDTYLQLYLFNDVSYNVAFNLDDYLSSVTIRHYRDMEYSIYENGTEYITNYSDNPNNSLLMDILDNLNKAYNLYDTNFNYKTNSKLSISGFYIDNIELNNGATFPTIKELLNYSSWNDYADSQYTEVSLDNYEYAILSLKNYSKKEAFETNLQVKGMIGITPVYEYGTVEKNAITDRCNISYDEFTDYRLYVLKDDLINNSVYYVKACEKGSSFKFDNTIFDITYVTAETVDDPVITVGGKEYHTIPFDKLSNSANKNEEENFIPGASEGFNPIGALINSFENFLSHVNSIWDSLTSFMSLATKFFNTLPQEFRALSIAGFNILITIAVIKFLKS